MSLDCYDDGFDYEGYCLFRHFAPSFSSLSPRMLSSSVIYAGPNAIPICTYFHCSGSGLVTEAVFAVVHADVS